MLGAQPPDEAGTAPAKDKFVRALLGLLGAIAAGGALGIACAFFVLAIGALFGDVGGATGSSSLNPSILPQILASSANAAAAGAINFTLARYTLLTKSRMPGVAFALLAMAVIGGVLGLVSSGIFSPRRPLVSAEVGAIIAFWFFSLSIARRDDNRGREYFDYRYTKR